MIKLLFIWAIGSLHADLTVYGFHSMQECNQMKITYVMSMMNKHANVKIEKALCVIESES